MQSTVFCGRWILTGTLKGTKRSPNPEQNIIKALKAVEAKEKYLALEESNLTYWAAQVASAYVTEVIIK
jgi:hypothetical protein